MVKTGNFPTWMGTKIVKYPTDIMRYQEIIYQNKPDFIVETGTYKGGSALFFAQMFELMGNGHVISVDIKDHEPPKHPRITHILGRATGVDTLEKIKGLVGDKKVMVILDSNHHRSHVKRELLRYKDIVTSGQYLVVEDTNYSEVGKANGPEEAIDWFMKRTNKFIREDLGEKFVFTLMPKAWLKRR